MTSNAGSSGASAAGGGADRDALAACLDEAVRLAEAAGAQLLEFVDRGVVAESKGIRRELVTAADRAAERVVVGGLQRRFPGHAVLAEEGVLTTQGKPSSESEWLWIVDPLDGTTNYVHGIPFYCVAIALAYRGDPVVGVVHAPALGETYAAARGAGATHRARDGRVRRLQVSATAAMPDALLATGFSYNRNEPGRDDNTRSVAHVLPRCRDLRRLGSAELDLCLVAAGVYDGYWERYLQPYDVAAGAVMVREAGGAISEFDGGGGWLFGDSVVATNGHLHAELRQLLRAAGASR